MFIRDVRPLCECRNLTKKEKKYHFHFIAYFCRAEKKKTAEAQMYEERDMESVAHMSL